MPLILFSILGWGFLLWYAHNHPIKNVPFGIRGGGGGNDEPAPLPSLSSPESVISSSSILTALQDLYNQYKTASVNAPSQWGTVNDVYNQLLGYTPEQFAYPMEDIQKALESQQALQMQQYQQQIRPTMATQGQLDSTYYANMISDYLKGQQSQSLTNTANLLTNQATQNYNLQQWLPQFKSTVANQLQNLGTSQLDLSKYNLTLPLNTYGAGMSDLYNTGSNQAQNLYNTAMAQWQQDEQIRQNEEAQRNALYSTIGMFSPLGGAIYGGVSGGSSGVVSSLGGSMDMLKTLLPFISGGMGGTGGMDLSGLGSSMYNPQWNTSYGGGSSGSSTPYNVQGMYMPQYKNY